MARPVTMCLTYRFAGAALAEFIAADQYDNGNVPDLGDAQKLDRR